MELVPAFVLHCYPYGDSSAVVELFTRGAGRVGVIAKGVRGSKSRRRGLLQPFIPLLVSWGGRGELGILRHVEALGVVRRLPPHRLPSGFYLNELLLRLVERNEPLPQMFDTYSSTLADLHQVAEESAILRLFERELLNELGVGLVLTHDCEGEPLIETGWYRYLSASGPKWVAESDSQPPDCVSGASLLAFANDWLIEASVLRDAQAVTRQALAEQLGGRPLRSRELLPLRQSNSAKQATGTGKKL